MVSCNLHHFPSNIFCLSFGAVFFVSLCCGGSGGQSLDTTGTVTGEEASAASAIASSSQGHALSPSSPQILRQKRAPGWGKRSEADMNALDDGDEEVNDPRLRDDEIEDDDDDDDELLELKRAPGWGKRAPGWGKRAPGWGKRAPGWGKRAPGWGKRAPGWGKRADVSLEREVEEEKRAPGWGKRAPGWGKRAPGWGKRAPGWGKRAPGWGKRAPGWGKRSGSPLLGRLGGQCELWNQELEFILDSAIEVESRLQAFCGSTPAILDISTRK